MSAGGSSELAEDMVECSLQAEEVQLAEAMLARTMSLGQAAAEKGVKLMIDAEHTYFQPAIDHTAKALMGMYNREKPIIFNTYQVGQTARWWSILHAHLLAAS